MKYFMRTTPEPGETAAPPTPELFAEMGRFIEEGFKTGALVATGALDPRTTRLVSKNGTVTVTDGPYTEAKEAVVGWAIVNVGSREEAIEYSKRFWALVGDGSGTLQRIYDPGEMPEGSAA